MNPSDFLPILSVVLSVATVLGGLFAFKRGQNKEVQAIEDRVIAAQEKELKILRDRIADLEKDRRTQNRVITAIRSLLKQYNLHIIIDGDMVTVESQHSRKSVKVAYEEEEEEVG